MLLLALIASTPSRIAKDTLLIPFGVALSSTVFHIIYVLAFACRYGYNQQTDTPTFADRSASSVSFQEIRVRVKGHGGWPIYAFAVGRLIGCILLFALSATTLHRHLSLGSVVANPALVLLQYPETFMTLTYVRRIFYHLIYNSIKVISFTRLSCPLPRW